MDSLVYNALQVYGKASPKQIVLGQTWYKKAWIICCKIAASDDWLTPEQVAGAISALSPRTSWETSIELTRDLIRDGDCKSTLSRKSKAMDILLGKYGDTKDSIVTAFSPKTAPKTRAFFLAICGDSKAVAVDHHICNVLKVQDYALHRRGRYEKYANAIRDAAKKVGSLPAHFQAVVWVVIRDSKQ